MISVTALDSRKIPNTKMNKAKIELLQKKRKAISLFRYTNVDSGLSVSICTESDDKCRNLSFNTSNIF